MSDNNKKISFSFSKIKKPPITKVSNNEEKEKVEYISCFDKKKDAINNERNEKSKKNLLVIPMISSNTFNGISAKIEKKNEQSKNVKCSEDNKHNNNTNGHSQDNNTDKQMTADEIAAAEILSSIKNSNEDKKNCSDFVIAPNIMSKSELVLSNESTIDYDQVPVSEFGLAMLRGMGWKENAGIGKEPRTVSTISPKLRPKGLGLGAKYKPDSENQEIKKKKESKRN